VIKLLHQQPNGERCGNIEGGGVAPVGSNCAMHLRAMKRPLGRRSI